MRHLLQLSIRSTDGSSRGRIERAPSTAHLLPVSAETNNLLWGDLVPVLYFGVAGS